MMNNKKLTTRVCALLAAFLISGCASTGTKQHDDEPNLKPGYARIQFKASNHIPYLFQEKLYGLIAQVRTMTGDNIEIDPTGKSIPKRYVDVLPGSYKLSANCEPVNNHSGDQYNWLANYTAEVQANQICTLSCQYYDKEIVRPGTNQKRKTVRKVRIVHEDTEFVNQNSYD